MKVGDLVLYDHQFMNPDDRHTGTVLKFHDDGRVTLRCQSGANIEYRKKVLTAYCTTITEKEYFKLRLNGVR